MSISDFEFDLVSVIVMEDALLFEVAITCKQNKTCQVPSDLFSSMPRFKKWCQGRELEKWSGDQAALDGLYSLLNHPKKKSLADVVLASSDSTGEQSTGTHGFLPNETFGADPETHPCRASVWGPLVESSNLH